MATADHGPRAELNPLNLMHQSLQRLARFGLLGILLVSFSGWSFTRMSGTLYPQQWQLGDSRATESAGIEAAAIATSTNNSAIPARDTRSPVVGVTRQNNSNRTYRTRTVTTVHHSRIPAEFHSTRMRLAGITSDNRLKSFVKPQSDHIRPYKKSRTFSLQKVAATDSYSKHLSLQLTTPLFHFDGVGFPHVETNARPATDRYKPYRELLVSMRHSNGNDALIPNVRCWGYTPAQTWRRAKAYDAMIKAEADRNGISEHLVKAVIARESCYRPQALSPAGARGLMQLMPATARWLGVTDLDSIEQNLRAGTRYLAQQLRRFENPSLALAAYNAGPGAVAAYGEIPPYPETQHYVERVLFFYHGYLAAATSELPAAAPTGRPG